MAQLLLVFLFCIWTPVAFSAGEDFNYDASGAKGPSNWGGDCQTGKKQSPINVVSANAMHDQGLGAFTLTNYNAIPANTKFNVSNNGHSLVVSFPEKVYNVSGGGLTGVYTTVQYHLHWGSVNTKGSEHQLDGKEYAAELHFVSYNTKYDSFTTAVSKSDGLAVLGVFIEVGSDNNSAYDFLKYAKDVINADDKKTGIDAFKFQPMLPTDRTQFYRYNGSLTTPTCAESVTWTVFNEAVKISEYQINHLRMLKDSDNATMSNNYRPVQDLHGRKVHSSFMVPTTAMTATTKQADATTTAGATAVSMTAGLFLLMMFAAIFVR